MSDTDKKRFGWENTLNYRATVKDSIGTVGDVDCRSDAAQYIADALNNHHLLMGNSKVESVETVNKERFVKHQIGSLSIVVDNEDPQHCVVCPDGLHDFVCNALNAWDIGNRYTDKDLAILGRDQEITKLNIQIKALEAESKTLKQYMADYRLHANGAREAQDLFFDMLIKLDASNDKPCEVSNADGKGRKHEGMTFDWLMKRMFCEYEELEAQLGRVKGSLQYTKPSEQDIKAAQLECADVANFCAFIHGNLGRLLK